MPQSSVDVSKQAVSIRIELHAHIEKAEEGGYVSYCPELGVCSQGETVKEAKENIIEASQLFLESCIERGVLRDVLLARGFRDVSEKSKRKRKLTTLPAASPSARVIKFPAEAPMFILT